MSLVRPSRAIGWMRIWLAVLAVGLAASARSGAAAPAPKPAGTGGPSDPRLSKQLSLEVRSADLREFTSRLTGALGVRVEADAGIADQRLTLRAANVTLGSLQHAVAALLHSHWKATGEEADEQYRLQDNAELKNAAAQLRAQRLTIFLRRLLETEQALQRRRPELVARSIRDSVAVRMPYLSEEALDEITPEYLEQTYLADPLRLGLVNSLVKNDQAWVALRRLSPAHQQLLARYFLDRFESGSRLAAAPGEVESSQTVAAVTPNPQVLTSSQARLEYRLLFGDQWTGTSLVTRIGSADNWETAVLPSTLFAIPDYVSLYPEADNRPAGKELDRNVNVRIDTDTDTWDQALTLVARTAGINVISDSYLRPEVFHPKAGGPLLIGTTLGETLDHLSDYYGFTWWRDGDWYLFRNRLWYDQQRVAVSPRILQAMSNSAASAGRLSSANLSALAALPEDQLLSLQLYGSAAGRNYAPESSMDLNQLDLLRAGLTLYAQLPQQQRETARDPGMPAMLMPAMQQFEIASMAFDRGIPLDPYDQPAWRFRLTDQFDRQKLPTGWAELGTVTVEFDFGQYGTRKATLALRLPASETKTADQGGAK